MKVPKHCPWCGRLYVDIFRYKGKETPIRTVTYDCGTKVTEYPAAVQVTSFHWYTKKQWEETLRGEHQCPS